MVYSGMVVSVIVFIVLTMVTTIACTPRHGQSWTSFAYLPRLGICSKQVTSCGVATGVIGVLLDLYLLYLPCPILWRLHMQRAKKIRIIAIFMTGSVYVGTLELCWLQC